MQTFDQTSRGYTKGIKGTRPQAKKAKKGSKFLFVWRPLTLGSPYCLTIMVSIQGLRSTVIIQVALYKSSPENP